MKLLATAVLMSTMLALGACTPPVPEEAVEQEVASMEADIEAVRAIVDNFDVALAARDADALAALYAPDAYRMSNEVPTWHGRDAIRAGFAREFEEQGGGEVDNVVEDVVVLGDRAIFRGTYTETLTPEDGGEPVVRSGKWMALAMRSADGSWRTLWDIWNRDAPVETQ